MFDFRRADFAFSPASPARPKYQYHLRKGQTKPVVSIITPFYNTGKIFEETARSVFAQSFQQWEWIIVDDGSTLKYSKKLLNEVRKDQRVRIIRQDNRGPSAARNLGFKSAITDYVLPLDSDDLLEPTAIEKLLWFLITHPNASFVNGFTVNFNAHHAVWRHGFQNTSHFLFENQVCVVALIRKKIHQEVNGYDENITAGFEDWDFWLKCAEQQFWGCTIPEIVCWYRRRNDHSEKWKEWTTKGAKNFIRKSSEKYSRIYSQGILEKTNIITGLLKRPDLNGVNLLGKKNKRLLLLLPWFEMGGADLFNLNLVKEIQKVGWEITIITTLPSEHPWLKEFASLTPDIFCLDHFIEIEHIPAFLEYIIASRNFDVAMITHSHIGYLLLKWLRLRFPSLPIVDYLHAIEPTWLNGGYPRFSVGQTGKFDRHIASNIHLKNWMVNEGANAASFDICPTYISTKLFKSSPSKRNKIRKQLKISSRIPVIIFPARFHSQKRPLLVLEIARRVAKANKRFVLLCVGSGELEKDMKAFVARNKLQKNVRFLGPMENKDVARVMKVADILLLPSAYEGLALVIYEAMAAGVAVLASAAGGQEELVGTSYGHLIPIGNERHDAELYSALLIGWISNIGSLKKIRLNAQKHVQKNFDIARLGLHMNRILLRAIENRKRTKAKRGSVKAINAALQAAVSDCKFHYGYIWQLNKPASKKVTIKTMIFLYWRRLIGLAQLR